MSDMKTAAFKSYLENMASTESGRSEMLKILDTVGIDADTAGKLVYGMVPCKMPTPIPEPVEVNPIGVDWGNATAIQEEEAPIPLNEGKRATGEICTCDPEYTPKRLIAETALTETVANIRDRGMNAVKDADAIESAIQTLSARINELESENSVLKEKYDVLAGEFHLPLNCTHDCRGCEHENDTITFHHDLQTWNVTCGEMINMIQALGTANENLRFFDAVKAGFREFLCEYAYELDLRELTP